MNQFRKDTVRMAFEELDTEKAGSISASSLKSRFNAKKHPDVQSGKRTEDEVLVEFLETFDTFHKFIHPTTDNLIVMHEEFEEYYSYFNQSIDDDKTFKDTLIKVWDLKFEEKQNEELKEEKKELKITKPYLYLGETRPSYKKNLSNLPSDENTLHSEAMLENEKRAQDKKQKACQNFQEALNKFKSKLAKRGIRGLFGFAKQLSVNFLMLLIGIVQ